MEYNRRHIIKNTFSTIEISASSKVIWDNITNVRIEQFPDLFIFKILDIPKPIKAEVVSEGKGGRRIAYFNTGKRFMQEIIDWVPFDRYSFSFNPELGFRVCYFFELSEGIFRIPFGEYSILNQGQKTFLKLNTTYSIDRRFYLFLQFPVWFILKIFQRYLLTSIKNISQRNEGPKS
jgi:hypothetical protein